MEKELEQPSPLTMYEFDILHTNLEPEINRCLDTLYFAFLVDYDLVFRLNRGVSIAVRFNPYATSNEWIEFNHRQNKMVWEFTYSRRSTKLRPSLNQFDKGVLAAQRCIATIILPTVSAYSSVAGRTLSFRYLTPEGQRDARRFRAYLEKDGNGRAFITDAFNDREALVERRFVKLLDTLIDYIEPSKLTTDNIYSLNKADAFIKGLDDRHLAILLGWAEKYGYIELVDEQAKGVEAHAYKIASRLLEKASQRKSNQQRHQKLFQLRGMINKGK